MDRSIRPHGKALICAEDVEIVVKSALFIQDQIKDSTMAGGHGGRRKGAGRTPGSGWKPKVSAMRAETVKKMHKIVASDKDPLSVVVGFVLDEALDVQTRMSAASICLPYLFPRLSQTQVDARHIVTTVDATHVLEKLNERLERLGKSEPASPPMIEVRPEPEDDDGAGGNP
jgi:hypothetical protein